MQLSASLSLPLGGARAMFRGSVASTTASLSHVDLCPARRRNLTFASFPATLLFIWSRLPKQSAPQQTHTHSTQLAVTVPSDPKRPLPNREAPDNAQLPLLRRRTTPTRYQCDSPHRHRARCQVTPINRASNCHRSSDVTIPRLDDCHPLFPCLRLLFH